MSQNISNIFSFSKIYLLLSFKTPQLLTLVTWWPAAPNPIKLVSWVSRYLRNLVKGQVQQQEIKLTKEKASFRGHSLLNRIPPNHSLALLLSSILCRYCRIDGRSINVYNQTISIMDQKEAKKTDLSLLKINCKEPLENELFFLSFSNLVKNRNKIRVFYR